MLDKLGQTFSGVINSVMGFGFFVTLNDVFIEGLVHVTALKNDYYHYDEQSHCLYGERSKKRYSLGDEITVVVARVGLDERKIDFVLEEILSQKDGKTKNSKNKKRKKRKKNKSN